MMQERTRKILVDLERVRENLLGLSDDIWLSIDHNNNDAVDRYVPFKKEYNDRMAAFDRLAGELSVLVQQFTKVRVEEDSQSNQEPADEETNDRLVRELDKEEPHTLFEDFTYKRPYGFVLKGRACKGLVTWRNMYMQVCQVLSQMNSSRFKTLPENPAFISKRGNQYFSKDPDCFRWPLKVANGFYAEGNFSSNYICKMIADLLTAFGISHDNMVIYLREDRDAEE